MAVAGCGAESETKTVTVIQTPGSGTESRLQGPFRITSVPTERKGVERLPPRSTARWSFQSSCEAGACVVTARRKLRYGGTVEYTLKPAGGRLHAQRSFTGFGTCPDGRTVIGGYRVKSKLEIGVTDTKIIDGEQRATEFVGTLRDRLTQRAGDCELQPARVSYELRGTLLPN